MTIDFILLIPCYNNWEGLIKSINSVKYPKDRFEILIVDDGSASPILQNKLNEIYPNVTFQLLRLNTNQGILNALNAGLKALEKRNDYNYIARLDAGDTCHAERFIKQVEFLNMHTDIFLLGTWCRFENPTTGKGYDYITQTEHVDILKEMHLKCSFIHPTVMFRSEILKTIGYYPEGYPHAEDYAYFWKIAKKYKTRILCEQLVTIAIQNGLSQKNRGVQMQSRIKIIKQYGFLFRLKIWSIIRMFIILVLPYGFVLRLKKNFLHHG